MIYVSDVHLLEQLNDEIKYSSEAMVEIDQRVIQHIYSVKESLGRQLHHIQMNLDEAEARLDEAERAESACHARQHRNEAGELVPSCSLYENAAAKALEEAEKWREKKRRAQQIYDECQREISAYLSGGHEFIQNMSNQQVPQANQKLQDIIDRIHSILDTTLIV